MRLALLAGTTLAAAALASPPTFTLQPYGFRDPEHIYFGNYIQFADRISPSGAVAGRTYLSNEIGGSDAFLFADGVTSRINLADAEHTHSSGGRGAGITAINARNQVLGSSARFSGSTSLGSTAWVYADGVTRRLGLTQGEYTRDDGSRRSYAGGINEQGLITGESSRYLGGNDAGRAVWMDDHGALTRLGYFDAAHTSSTGYQDSRVSAPDPQGRCVGWSVRYPQGSDAWIYDDGVYTPIGLDDAEHTSPTGVRASQTFGINARGDIAGSSTRWVEDISAGYTAWVRSPDGAMHRLGLTDAEHTEADTGRVSLISRMTQNGFVVGISRQYADYPAYGWSVWVWDGAAVTRAGLIGPEFTAADGRRHSETTLVGPTGVVAGQSWRLGSPGGGQGAWVHAGGRTVAVGLTDAAHTGPRDQRYSRVTAVNAAGDAVGFSERYDSEESSRSGWFYNHADGSLTPLIFSTRADGFVNSYPTGVTDDGAVIGSYSDYQTSTPRSVAFWWSAAEGRYDLAELVEGGLAQSGFTGLSGASTCTTLASGAALITAAGPVSTPEPAVHALLTSTGRTLCLPDFNRDGFLDFFDYADFVAAFEAGEPGADFNRDDFLDFFDYLGFTQAFETGC